MHHRVLADGDMVYETDGVTEGELIRLHDTLVVSDRDKVANFDSV